MRDVEFLKNNGVNVDQGLEVLGDMEMYDDTLNDFLEESETRIPNLKMYKDAGDMANYAILVHSMKSDSKYLGFTKLAELSLDHELKGKENDAAYVNANFDSLMNEANRIIDVVKKYLG